jgi:prephenate dehydrogenase
VSPPVCVGIIGLGLIGGSLARALTRAGHTVIGVDRAPVGRRARAAGAIARAAATPEEAAAEATIVVLAAPPEANLRMLRRLAPRVAAGQIVTDVGSVKTPICREAMELGLAGFVGGHPMAGAETSGFRASRAALFEGRPWILTPASEGRPVPQALRRLVRAVGARPVVLSPEDHDRAVAFLSHLPQVLAWALAAAVRADPVARRHLRLAGPGYRDMTRLAASPRPLWREILGQNRREVARALAGLRRAFPGAEDLPPR